MKKYNNNNYSIGRKIPPEYENPIDNFLLELCDNHIKFCTDNNITPNNITLFRIVLGIVVIYRFNISNDIYIPTLGTFLFYWLDCLDGHLARSTNQVSILGDYLDHGADVIFLIALIISILYKKYTNKSDVLTVIIILLYLAMVHLGLQQKNYKVIKEEIKYENNLTSCNNKIIITYMHFFSF